MLLVEREEEQLIARAKAGDAAAFELLAQRYAAPVFRLAVRMLGNSDDAEDVRQETFIQAYLHFRSYRGEAPLLTWLYAIAAKLCMRRRRGKRVELPIELAPPLVDTADPEQAFFAHEAQYRIQRVLATLSPPDRLFIILKHIEGLSHEEIAQVLHCSVESSRSRLNRARKLFRERFQREMTDGTV